MSDQPQPTPEEVNRLIEQSLGGDKLVGLKKRGLWYRPNASGYTDRESEAGRYTVEEAKKHGYLHGDPSEWVTICRFAPRNFWSSLDACAEMEKALDTPELRDAYANELFGIVPHDENHGPAFDGGEDIMLPSNFSYVTANSHRRCTAYLRVKGLWRWG